LNPRTRRLLLGTLALVLLAAGIGLGGMALWWRWAGRPIGGKRPVRVTVEKGATPAGVGEMLEARGVIRSARAFAMRARRTLKPGAAIQPGVYDVSPGESPDRILDRLVRGDVATIKATFPEGFTAAQVAKRLARNGIADEAAFLDLATRRGNTLRASFKPPANLEGYLFPDTYRFPVGESAEGVAQRMIGSFDKLVARGEAAKIKQSRRTLRDIVIIASLIEREARVDRDRARIAGVIYNRLARKMRLQIDATVQYARGQHASRLLFRDLEVESPYNTYKIAGLPPGPICNPGLPSLRAALSPERHPFLFYVARRDGSHLFGRTLAEHQHNIALARRGG
jgi:UPF0755 protein